MRQRHVNHVGGMELASTGVATQAASRPLLELNARMSRVWVAVGAGHGTCEFRRRRHGETGLIDTKAPESPGCRRRRRNGECNFRRRRLKTDKPSCTGPGIETCLDVDSPCT